MKESKLQILNKKYKSAGYQGGMTYVELIVVLGIFAIMSSIVVFDYGKFQARVNIKNLANDIALQIVTAQKDALAGKWNTGASSPSWKPAYGVNFNTAVDNKRFIYFVDLDNDLLLDGSVCTGECLNNITITKGNYISALAVVGTSCSPINTLSVVFTRPNSFAKINTNINNEPGCTGIKYTYAEVTISSPNSVISKIRVYPSGRVQLI